MFHCFESDRQQNISDLKCKVTSLGFILFYWSCLNVLLGSRTLHTTYAVGKADELFCKLGNQNPDCKRLGTKVVQFSQIQRTWRNLFNLNTALGRKVLLLFLSFFVSPLIQQGKAMLAKMFFKGGLGILCEEAFCKLLITQVTIFWLTFPLVGNFYS